MEHSMRWVAVIVALLMGMVAVAQIPAEQKPQFEVATIKPTDPSFGGILMRLTGGKFSATGFTLKDLIAFAYAVDNSQIGGGPEWLASDRYDVLGKPEKAGPLSRDAARIMLRPLLADRFHLKIHLDTKPMSVFVLTIEKNGPKLRPRTAGDGGETTHLTFHGASATGRNVPVKVLAEELQDMVLSRPVLDKTGLMGNFDFDLVWRPEPKLSGIADASPSVDLNLPDIFTAIQEQLGLKLESTKAPTEVIVIDSAEHPSEN
jgi:uncharacterized protein (TIGR03435 family)